MSNSTTLLDTISTTQSNKEVVVNALLDATSPATIWGRHASACTALTWGYYGGQYGTNAIANGTVTLTASTTNYVYADNSTGAVSVNTTGVPSGKIPLYSIVTGTTTVSTYTDLRSYAPTSQVGGGALSSLSDVNVTEGVGINGYALTWNNATSKWVATNLSAGALSGLTDVNVSEGSGIDGYSLVWNNATSKWIATLVSGGGSSTLAALTDVAVQENADLDTYILGYRASVSAWVGDALTLGMGPNGMIDAAHMSSTAIVLSNNNLTATGNSTATSQWQASRTIGSRSHGKFYAEATVTAFVSGVGLGVCNSASSQALNAPTGNDTNGVMFLRNGSGLSSSGAYYNGSFISGSSPPAAQVTTGQVIAVAVDMTAKKVWFYDPATSKWNNDVIANQNPATGTGGYDLTTIMAGGTGVLYLAPNILGTSASITLNTGYTAFNYTVPAGFQPWYAGSLGLVQDVAISNPTNGQSLSYSSAVNKWVNGSTPYDMLMFCPGVPGNSALMSRVVIPRVITIPSGATGSYASAGTAATASTVLTLAKNGTSVGTITFAASATTGTFTVSSAITTAAGDVLTLTNQSTADATLANISITLAATR